MRRFSALQRAEIAEMQRYRGLDRTPVRFSALQRAEIAEIGDVAGERSRVAAVFQCSSTSRNC